MLRRQGNQKPRSPVLLVGRGHWGSALEKLLSSGYGSVVSVDKDSPEELWQRALLKKPLVVIACPFSAIPPTLERLRKFPLTAVVNASKGIDRGSLLTFSALAEKKLRCPVATLSGPTFAKEVLEKKPTASVIAGRDLRFVSDFARRVSNEYFRIYVSGDPLGVEVCGAVKNVLAIACGLSDGLKLGFNARAALLTRGLVELQVLVKLLGGRPETVFGLAGVGDLWLTATGDLSRNRQLGLNLAKGLTLEKSLQKLDGTCEGIYTVRQVHALLKEHKLELPICEQIYRICFENQNPKKAIRELMTRELKFEASKSTTTRRTKSPKSSVRT